MNELKEIHNYWRNPCIENTPWSYVVESEPSINLVYSFDWYKIPKDSKILEIGCNVGRNLVYLYNAGYKNLTGIEINENAIEIGRMKFPELKEITIITKPVEEVIKDFPDNSFDMIFTVAVLEHIHPDSTWIFKEMVRIAKKNIFLVEDEEGHSLRHFPRNYKEIFENLGVTQTHEEKWDLTYANLQKLEQISYKLLSRMFKK